VEEGKRGELERTDEKGTRRQEKRVWQSGNWSHDVFK
jgi:hypothetical protein